MGDDTLEKYLSEWKRTNKRVSAEDYVLAKMDDETLKAYREKITKKEQKNGK